MPAPVEMTMAPETRLQRKDDRYLANPVGEEIVLLNLDTGDYLGLNRVAATIWRLLEHPISLTELEHALMSEYDTDPRTCRDETMAFIQRIADLGLLIETTDQHR